MTNEPPPVDEPPTPTDSPVKRGDVGFKRPPVEHQFKKGQKPPPRKKKEKLGEVSMIDTLRKVLGEERRVVQAGKVRWVTVADLVIRRAWLEAEKGSATLRREMCRLSLSFEAPVSETALLVVTDPSAPASETGLRLVPIDESPT